MSEHKEVQNKLGQEKSPYLLQHAENPVSWLPWGEEAFLKAKSEDKPLFISIGYSTCHWCHVMARESFEDSEVAEELNRNYVPVKVDREERPDVDHVYMGVCQMLTGSGGWPLTVIATPDRKPFFAGTYFPKNSRFGLPGLLNVLQVISEGWASDKAPLVAQAERIHKAIIEERRVVPASAKGPPDTTDELLDRAFSSYSRAFDEEYGGFGAAPKFPSPHNLMFLLRYWKRSGKKRALEMVEKTVRGAYAGGIYDHIGFGFFRYSTDAKWMVPHFEKMLYDNALFLMTMSELWQATQKDTYRQVASELVTFIEQEMTSSQGGFYSAIDAESEGEEGKYYVWRFEDVVASLGAEDAKEFAKRYGIAENGKFHGFSVPRLVDVESAMESRDSSFEKMRRKLYASRGERVRPNTDDKVLTSWNGLMISALAKAYVAFRDDRYLTLATRAYEFIQENLERDGSLYARYRDGDVAYEGYLDDYAFLTWAELELYQATHTAAYLKSALSHAKSIIDLFYDEEEPGFFLTRAGAHDLIVRPKDQYDGAMPSGNSVAVMDLLRLSHILGIEELEEPAMSAIDLMRERLKQSPTAYGLMLAATSYSAGAQDILLSARKNDPTVGSMLNYMRALFLPESQVVFAADRAEVLGQDPPENPPWPTATVCQNRICGAPLNTVAELQKALITPH